MSATISADRWLRRAIASIVGLALIAAVLGIGVYRARVDEERRHDATAAAAKSVPAVLSYRPSTVRSDLRRERRLVGKPFSEEFTSLVTDVVAPKATKRGITTRATVVSSGVSSSEGRTVTLLMFVNVTTTDRASNEPAVTGSRLKVTMQQAGHTWRIVGLDPV